MTELRRKNFDACTVSVKKNGKFVAIPSEILNYRHPELAELEIYRYPCMETT